MRHLRPPAQSAGESPIGNTGPHTSPCDIITADTFRPTLAPPEWTIPVPHYCLHCGYDLRGLPDGRPCSECGKPIDWPGHVKRLDDYHRRSALRILWNLVNFFCVLPHGIWALRDTNSRAWQGRSWKTLAVGSLLALTCGALLASATFVETRNLVWYTNGSQSTEPVVVQTQTDKFLGGVGIVARSKAIPLASPGPEWTPHRSARRILRLSMSGIGQDGPILLALYCPLLLTAITFWPMRRLILRFAVVDAADPIHRQWIRQRLYPVWLAFPPAIALVTVGMGVNLAWSLWPQWIPDKAKEFVIVWGPNAATLIPPYFVMRILSADYTKRLFPNRWILGAIVLACMNTIPWMTGQFLYWKAMAATYAVASPLSRILSTWPF